MRSQTILMRYATSAHSPVLSGEISCLWQPAPLGAVVHENAGSSGLQLYGLASRPSGLCFSSPGQVFACWWLKTGSSRHLFCSGSIVSTAHSNYAVNVLFVSQEPCITIFDTRCQCVHKGFVAFPFPIGGRSVHSGPILVLEVQQRSVFALRLDGPLSPAAGQQRKYLNSPQWLCRL